MKAPIAKELWRKRHYTWEQLFQYKSKHRLTKKAVHFLCGAGSEVTGMAPSVTRYWLAQIMSEAIEAAEALGV